MQVVIASSGAGAQCSVFGQLSRFGTDSLSCRAGWRCQRARVLSTKHGKNDGWGREAGVVLTRYLRKPDWRCCASVSVEDGIDTKELNPLTSKESEIPTVEVFAPEGPTVQVKFVLEKKCEFGQHFKVVGNNLLFGSWSPEAAIAMNWAEGHLWSVEVDVPTGEQIEYKFVLTGENEEVEWQPGPNHVLEIAENVSALTVEGAWDPEDKQEMVELPEEPESPTRDTAPTATEELSKLSGIGGLLEAVKEEITADLAIVAGLAGTAKEEVISEITSNLGDVNGSPLSENVSSVESSKTAPQVVLTNATPISGIVQAAVED